MSKKSLVKLNYKKLNIIYMYTYMCMYMNHQIP